MTNTTSQIDVISCGYNHTIAMTSSREIDDVTAKLYGWGSCSSGQLGVGRVVHSVPTPSLFTDIWTEGNVCTVYLLLYISLSLLVLLAEKN